ncbi:phosphoribosyltransferase domain-containing protein [Arthrobacter sp. LAPM80]|uniref:phosphoribosyltransferase domain-containing protein n=1 Tax=Arthrobacter sp. LAPM80 TaxID=3141788 RepID=UPI00398ADB24
MSGGSETPAWTGGFVAGCLDVAIHSDPAGAVAVQDLVGLAVRRNPKRAHLLVSRVLAKHVPTEPALVIAAGELLGAFVARELYPSTSDATRLSAAAGQLTAVLASPPGQRQAAIAALAGQVAGLRTVVPDAVVIGYAETATGLGRLVANALGAYYIHSTRHATPGVEAVAGFQEGHSHATSHAMVPTDPQWLQRTGPVILVDDEFSTGSTVINTIRELHALTPHGEYVVAALIDLRSAEDRARFEALAAELGARISVTALGTGWIELPEDLLGRGQTLVEHLQQAQQVVDAPGGRLAMLELAAEDLTPVRSDRFGNRTAPAPATIEAIAGHVGAYLAAHRCQGPFIVLGCEENMFLPLAVARELDRLRPDADVRFSTTTRSPIVPLDRHDYAIAGALTFASHDLTNDGPGPRFAYNLNGTGQRPGTIVVFPEPGTGRDELLHSSVPVLPPLAVALRAVADDVLVVLLPADNPATTPQTEVSP